MGKYVWGYVVTGLVFCALDFVWLTMIALKFYQGQIGPLLLEKPNLVPAAIFYALYVVGLVVFCVVPAVATQSWPKAALLGALLGMIAYATYDLSNLATLNGWTIPLSVMDIAWGAIASSAACTAGYFGTNVIMGLME
jgi:uncharacterized membrane protein